MRGWLPENAIVGVIVAVHGFNDYSNFISGNTPFLNENGFGVYAYDQRGFGGTSTKGRWSGRSVMTEDLHLFITLVQRRHPDTPIYLLGDSMGGAVTIATMRRHKPSVVKGVILVAPAVWARTEMPIYQRLALWLGAHTFPWLKVSGRGLTITPSDNREMLEGLGRDPLVLKETRIEVLYGLSNLMDEAYSAAEDFPFKTLLLYGEKDEIIPREPIFSFYHRLPATSDGTQRMILYENGYHMLLRDLQADVVLSDIVSWLKENE